MTEPRNALIKQYRKLFSYDNVALSFDEDAIEEVAQLALERKTGARGLRSILEKVMMDVMYRIPSDETIRECQITREAVEGKSQPLVIHR